MSGIDSDKLYTRREVANMGFRSYDSLAADACKGVGIPIHKFGSKVMYLGKDILAFIDAARVPHENAEPESTQAQ